MSILNQIFQYKKQELEIKKKTLALAELKEKMLSNNYQHRDFAQAINQAHNFSIIAEYKIASPSAGVIQGNPDMNKIIQGYAVGGAKAISVLTDEKFFQGKLEYLSSVRKITTLPLLRKDFIFDPYQIYESRLFGADAILLIARMLTSEQLIQLTALARKLKLEILFEVHNQEDIKKVIQCQPKIIGINARNLQTMNIDLKQIETMLPHLPNDIIVVAESGIKSKKDIQYIQSLDIHAALIGTTLMSASNPQQTLKQLLN